MEWLDFSIHPGILIQKEGVTHHILEFNRRDVTSENYLLMNYNTYTNNEMYLITFTIR